MPYLTNEDKSDFNFGNRVDEVTDYLNNLKIENLAGHINYLNFIIVRRWIKKNGKKYFIFAAITGTLILCILEIWRRIICDYEDSKIGQNGDAE